jgi:hypothetical protein
VANRRLWAKTGACGDVRKAVGANGKVVVANGSMWAQTGGCGGVREVVWWQTEGCG